MESIIFSLLELREFITRSLPHIELLRTHWCAEKLMKEARVREEKETSAQYKQWRRDTGKVLV